MRHAVERVPAGLWPPEAETATVTLAHADRHRRRIRMFDDDGTPFLLDLPRAEYLHDGDGLRLEEGGVLRVVAAEEAVADIACADTVHLARVAWHLGNRHLAVQVLDDGRLRIAHDHVIEDMVEGLGASVTRRTAPFQPEGGAYAAGHGGHGHGHAHGGEQGAHGEDGDGDAADPEAGRSGHAH